MSHWQSSISPNAMISTLSTLSKSMILVAIAATIGQQKWQYFGRGQAKRLMDIDLFHEASQGPFGAVKFVLRMRLSAVVASLAAAVIIVALAFEPMAQQVLSYESRLAVVPDLISSIPIAQIYSSTPAYHWDADYNSADFNTTTPQGTTHSFPIYPSFNYIQLLLLKMCPCYNADYLTVGFPDISLMVAVREGLFDPSVKG